MGEAPGRVPRVSSFIFWQRTLRFWTMALIKLNQHFWVKNDARRQSNSAVVRLLKSWWWQKMNKSPFSIFWGRHGWREDTAGGGELHWSGYLHITPIQQMMGRMTENFKWLVHQSIKFCCSGNIYILNGIQIWEMISEFFSSSFKTILQFFAYILTISFF